MNNDIKKILDGMTDIMLKTDWTKLLNYITNLQKENENYKSRNEKVVEYINLFKDDVRGLDDSVLLNILKGDDEE